MSLWPLWPSGAILPPKSDNHYCQLLHKHSIKQTKQPHIAKCYHTVTLYVIVWCIITTIFFLFSHLHSQSAWYFWNPQCYGCKCTQIKREYCPLPTYPRVGANSAFEANTNTNSIHFLQMKQIRIVFGFQKTIQIYTNSSNYLNMNTISANSLCQ